MSIKDVAVPDIGDFKDVPVIETVVSPGDKVNEDDPLVVLESDKATMEVPAPFSGEIKRMLVNVGDTVSEGTLVAKMEVGDARMPEPPSPQGMQEPDSEAPSALAAPAAPPAAPPAASADPGTAHASPSVRRLARELEIDLANVRGTGQKGRITKDDLRAHLAGPAGAPVGPAALAEGAGVPPIPAVDFSKFGETEKKPLSRIKRISGPHLRRAWLNIPHVTHNDEADITETEAYRKEMNEEAKKRDFRVTLLGFLMKASVSCLRKFPEFNASLAPDGEHMIYKRYYHIGVAVDTADGLVVPVVRDVDRKGVFDISRELMTIGAKARDGKLTANDMQGASFTISSLGGIGGVSFTPIVNAPEVAILGVVRSKMQPVWDGEAFQPRLILPLSLSYDHRVIDGALAARFTADLAHVISDVRRLVM